MKVKRKKVIGLFVGLVIVLILLIYYLNIFSVRKDNINLDKMINAKGEVVYYGTYENKEDVNEILKNFEDKHYTNLAYDKQTYIVYGNEFAIEVASYEDVASGNIKLIVGDNTQTFKLKENHYSLIKITPENNKVIVVVNGKDYEFDLKQGQNVYFIIAVDKNE